jgi:hypothetical protein
MKLVGLVFLGLVASGVIYGLLMFGIIKVFPSMNGEAGMLPGLFIVMPLSFLIGSFITGYFSFYELEDRWALLALPPALYSNLIWMSVAGIAFLLDAFINVNDRGHIRFRDAGMALLIGLFFYLASLAGVASGYFLRERFAKWWYGD